MRHHYQFMGRLDHAIGCRRRPSAPRISVCTRPGRLLQAELRLASLRKVLERRRADLLREQQRREQKADRRTCSAQRAAPGRAGMQFQE